MHNNLTTENKLGKNKTLKYGIADSDLRGGNEGENYYLSFNTYVNFCWPGATLGWEVTKKPIKLHVTMSVAMATAAILDLTTTKLVKFLGHLKSYFYQTNSDR